MARPLGCLTGSALMAASLAAVAILGLAAATGNAIFSPGELSGVHGDAPAGGVTSHADLGGRCDACHTAIWSGATMSDRCLACHIDVGQELTSKSGLHGTIATGVDCRACHTDHRGATASLTVADPRRFPHDRTGYSLRAHTTLAGGSGFCEGCHPSSLATFSAPSCVACHEGLDAPYMARHEAAFGGGCLACHDGLDSYGSDFDHASYPLTGGHAEPDCIACHRGATTILALRSTSTGCVACHAADDIHVGRLGTTCGDCHTPAAWTEATIDHDLTRFPLTGRHVGPACTACHVAGKWTGLELTCRSCHAQVDPHGGQFPGDCAACHVTSGWDDVTFSHATTGFALVNAHAKPACSACHPAGRFVGTPITCVGCHAGDDAHGGKFGKDCAACHRATTWSDWTFDHAKSGFPLTGAHASASCQSCHAGGRFAGTPTTCVSCHARPSSHGTGFSTACGACHSTKAWTPATFNGPHPFPMTHGGAGGVCAKCHPSSFSVSPCTVCHAHDPALMAEHHVEVSGYSVTGCLRCHPTGTSGD